MSIVKAQLESDTCVLSYKVGRTWDMRINTVPNWPFKLRLASAIRKGARKKTFIE